MPEHCTDKKFYWICIGPMRPLSEYELRLFNQCTSYYEEQKEALNKLKYFTEAEFACKCDRCAGLNNTGWGMSPRLLEVLDRIRERVGQPIYVLSGYRCPEHNAEVGGQPNSLHMQSCAADITYDDIHVAGLAKIAEEEGADGIGTYPSQLFVHVDTRGEAARWDESDY